MQVFSIKLIKQSEKQEETITTTAVIITRLALGRKLTTLSAVLIPDPPDCNMPAYKWCLIYN